MDKCEAIQTGIFLDNLSPQKPAVSQPQSTWVQQFCLISSSQNLWLTEKCLSVCLWHTGDHGSASAGLPCPVALPELLPCDVSELLQTGAPNSHKPGLLRLLCSSILILWGWVHTQQVPGTVSSLASRIIPCKARGPDGGAPNTSH